MDDADPCWSLEIEDNYIILTGEGEIEFSDNLINFEGLVDEIEVNLKRSHRETADNLVKESMQLIRGLPDKTTEQEKKITELQKKVQT